MKYSAPLYLASQSRARKELLTEAQIPFTLAQQSADESKCDWNQEPLKVASSIALAKMDHVILPPGTEGSQCYVITADTICVDVHGIIHGKPKDLEDARKMLRLWRESCLVITGYCLDKKVFTTEWQTAERFEELVETNIEFSVPDEWLEEYLNQTPAMSCAGAMAEGYGFQFVKTINGSYSNVIGLPLYQVRTALTKMGFFIF